MTSKVRRIRFIPKPDSPPDMSGSNILPGLARETVGLVAAATKVGKSKLLMQTAASVALGLDIFDLWGDDTTALTQGPVVYINLEDPDRFYTTSKTDLANMVTEFLNEGDIQKIYENFHTLSVSGTQFRIAEYDYYSRRVRTTADWDELYQIIREIKPVLIIIDTWNRAFSDLSEKDETLGSTVVQILESVAREMDCAVLVATHISKYSEREGELTPTAVRGTSAVASAARFFVGMRTMNEDEASKAGVMDAHDWVYRGRTYSNYGHSLPGRWFKRSENGVLERAELPTKRGGKNKVKAAGPTTGQGPRRV